MKKEMNNEVINQSCLWLLKTRFIMEMHTRVHKAERMAGVLPAPSTQLQQFSAPGQSPSPHPPHTLQHPHIPHPPQQRSFKANPKCLKQIQDALAAYQQTWLNGISKSCLQEIRSLPF